MPAVGGLANKRLKTPKTLMGSKPPLVPFLNYADVLRVNGWPWKRKVWGLNKTKENVRQ